MVVNVLIMLLAVLLYSNTFDTKFVWDDRAAVISNEDVLQSNNLNITNIIEIFRHDFWGQDIALYDSHKSYRPLTTITYRINHYFFALNPYAAGTPRAG